MRSKTPLPEFASQAANDWETFLALRALELRPGGRLVVVLPGLDDGGKSGFEDLMDQANKALAEMVDEGIILAEEHARMALGAYPRRQSELLAPFVSNGQFQQLSVEDCQLSAFEDAAWADYKRDGDKEALATKHARFFRSVFIPSLASALRQASDAEVCRTFGDQFENRLKRRLLRQPAVLRSFVSTIVLVKQSSA
jgi:hypothetical protein